MASILYRPQCVKHNFLLNYILSVWKKSQILWAGHVNIYGYVEPRSQHAALCSPLIMVHHQDNTIPHLQDYINWQVRIVQDSASVSLFMVMSWHRNTFRITRTLWRESTSDSRCHRPHVMDCNLKWALIKYILTHYKPVFIRLTKVSYHGMARFVHLSIRPSIHWHMALYWSNHLPD